MINPQHKPDNENKKINDDLMIVNQALVKIREAESKLQEIKYRLEYIVNAFQDEQKRRKIMKIGFNILPLYQTFEVILLNNILPVIRPSKARVDESLYRKFLQNDKLAGSLKIFKDEANTLLRDQSSYQDYRTFSEIFRESDKGLVEISYPHLTGVIEFLAHKEKFLLIRFENAQDFEELPESFFISFLRMDLITITLSFRKVPTQTSGFSGPKVPLESTLSDKPSSDGSKVVLYNIVYSNLFDRGAGKSISRAKNNFLYMNWKCVSINDPDVKSLVDVLKENQDNINIPCIYPSMGIFQRFSCYISERIEKQVKLYRAQIQSKKEVQEEILTQILKNYPDELAESIEGKCFICSNKFAIDPKLQRMLPPLAIKSETRKDKKGPTHIACKKMYENIETEGPQVLVKIDVSDDNDYFL